MASLALPIETLSAYAPSPMFQERVNNPKPVDYFWRQRRLHAGLGLSFHRTQHNGIPLCNGWF